MWLSGRQVGAERGGRTTSPVHICDRAVGFKRVDRSLSACRLHYEIVASQTTAENVNYGQHSELPFKSLGFGAPKRRPGSQLLSLA